MSAITFISGTPCTGKTTVSEILASRLDCDLIKINDFAISNDLILGVDDEKGYKIVDVEKLDKLLGETISGYDSLIVEGHLSHLCSGADNMIILRCRPEILEKRLAERNYSHSKILENVEAEAMGICLQEALEKYSDNLCELDVSHLSIEECVSAILKVINNEKKLTFGEIDFMDWLLTSPSNQKQ